jgi:hypothetical protein
VFKNALLRESSDRRKYESQIEKSEAGYLICLVTSLLRSAEANGRKKWCDLEYRGWFIWLMHEGKNRPFAVLLTPLLSEILSSRVGEYEDGCFMGCCNIHSARRLPTFRTYLLPNTTSSWWMQQAPLKFRRTSARKRGPTTQNSHLHIYGLFNDAVSSSVCTALNGSLNNE